MSAIPESPVTARIRRLQTHVRAHPLSPLFARLADTYLDAGDPEKALSICLEGLKLYPEYVSAHLVLAKTYLMLRRYHDARETLKKVVEISPVSTVAYELEKKSFELEKQYPPFHTFAYDPTTVDSSEKIETAADQRHKKWSQNDDLIPGAQSFRKKSSSQKPSKKTSTHLTKDEIDFDALAEELEHARIPVIPDDSISTSLSLQTSAPSIDIQSRPVTETLAVIYAQQKQYREAIRAYEILKQKFPDRAQEFEENITRLHELLKKQ